MNARPVLSPHDPRHVTAVHEAAHAVVGALYGLPMRAVSIVPKAGVAGYTRLLVPVGELPHPVGQVCVWLLAGPEGAKWFTRSARAQGAASDYQAVRDVLSLGQPDDLPAALAMNQRAARYAAMAAAHVITHEKWIRIVATQLLVEKALSAQTVRDLRPEEDQ